MAVNKVLTFAKENNNNKKADIFFFLFFFFVGKQNIKLTENHVSTQQNRKQ